MGGGGSLIWERMERGYSVKRLVVLVGVGGEGDTERERSA